MWQQPALVRYSDREQALLRSELVACLPSMSAPISVADELHAAAVACYVADLETKAICVAAVAVPARARAVVLVRTVSGASVTADRQDRRLVRAAICGVGGECVQLPGWQELVAHGGNGGKMRTHLDDCLRLIERGLHLGEKLSRDRLHLLVADARDEGAEQMHAINVFAEILERLHRGGKRGVVRCDRCRDRLRAMQVAAQFDDALGMETHGDVVLCGGDQFGEAGERLRAPAGVGGGAVRGATSVCALRKRHEHANDASAEVVRTASHIRGMLRRVVDVIRDRVEARD